MKISEQNVADVVQEASLKMSDPNYSAVMVGGFVQTQSAASEYLKANATELGGAEAVVNALFHAALIAKSFQLANNRTVREMSFDELNHVSDGDREATLKEAQPAVFEYITINVESAEMRRVLMLLALAMDWVS